MHPHNEHVFNQMQHLASSGQHIPTQQPGGQPTAQQMMAHHGVQHIPTNIISGTYINSNIIVHH